MGTRVSTVQAVCLLVCLPAQLNGALAHVGGSGTHRRVELVGEVVRRESRADGVGPFVVWQPEVQYATVVDAQAANASLLYNHDSSIAKFDGRWFVAWNGNRVPAEGQVNQTNYISTTLASDGMSGE